MHLTHLPFQKDLFAFTGKNGFYDGTKLMFFCESLFHLVIVIEDDVVKFEGEVHHKTSDVQD